MSGWTKEKPRAPFAWHRRAQDDGRTLGRGVTLPGESVPVAIEPYEYLEYDALSPVPARKSAREEIADVVAESRVANPDRYLPPGSLPMRLRMASDRLMSEPEIDVERLKRAMDSAASNAQGGTAGYNFADHHRPYVQRIATAYAKDGGK